MSVTPGPWQAPVRRLEEFAPVCPTKWKNKEPPAYDWMVEGCFLRGTVAILAGDGGLGKSLLCQQLQTAAAIGDTWLGLKTTKCKSLGIYCEDDFDELHRRQAKICQSYECGLEDLDPMLVESRAGRDSVLMQFERWGANGQTTEFYEQVAQAAKRHGAQIIILDTLADVFSGNEVDRNQPRTFIRALRKLAMKIQGVVILTQHPSVEGMANGSGRSGSTGWNNSVRSRLYLTLPKRKKDAEDEPTNERLLKTMKNNNGPFGGKIKLVWQRGVFRRVYEQETLPYYADKGDDEVEF